MYNKQSCRECGTWLTPHTFCTSCREHVGWVCGQCGRIDDYTHVHARDCPPVLKKEIVIENVQG
ncbi:hypothetical protein [Candidatus Nitrososphaera sp. FF02]|uniref:hypothetical protein n=1 Tax=Candidatus Nitrososphaera sp. FF02 TaxID=3398226 RepID=UPI0039E7C31C